MRISDWSSDVCSSDLRPGRGAHAMAFAFRGHAIVLQVQDGLFQQQGVVRPRRVIGRRVLVPPEFDDCAAPVHAAHPSSFCAYENALLPKLNASQIALTRSDEHTSELQSLMRISYAVFC